MLDSEIEKIKDAADKEEVLSVIFHRNTEKAPEVTLKYYTYDDTYDSLEINGTERFLVKDRRCKCAGKTDKKSILIKRTAVREQIKNNLKYKAKRRTKI